MDTPRAIGWRREGTYTGRPTPPPDPNPIRWRDCPHCWAGGRIYEQNPGEQWTVEMCPECLGVGQVTR